MIAMALSRAPRRAILEALHLPAALLLLNACSGQTEVQGSRDDGGDAPPGLEDASTTDGGGPTDAGTPEDAGADAAAPDPTCPTDWGVRADVLGTTPFGSFNGQYAWMGFYGGECGGIRIRVTEMSELDPTTQLPAPPLIEFSRTEGGGSYLGAGETDIVFSTGAKDSYTKGWLDLTRVDPWPPPDSPIDPANYPRVEGTISVDADGFTLKGSFVATYCADMNIYCP